MQVRTSLQTDNHASTPPLSFFTGRMSFLPPNQQRQSTEGMCVCMCVCTPVRITHCLKYNLKLPVGHLDNFIVPPSSKLLEQVIAPGAARRYVPADGSSTRSGSTSVRGRVRSPHMAKLQAASLPIAYRAAAPWDRQMDRRTGRAMRNKLEGSKSDALASAPPRLTHRRASSQLITSQRKPSATAVSQSNTLGVAAVETRVAHTHTHAHAHTHFCTDFRF